MVSLLCRGDIHNDKILQPAHRASARRAGERLDNLSLVIAFKDMIDETIVRSPSHFTGKSMQYGKAFTDALQFMWGEGFPSPGGPDEVADMLQRDSVLGRRVLDIGSGLGGVDALLVSQHGAAEVIGVDVEEELVKASDCKQGAAGTTSRFFR